MYWKEQKIYKNFYTLNGEGSSVTQKNIIIEPELQEYFVFFVKNRKYDLLEQMLLEVNEDLIDDTGKNLAFLSGTYKSYKLLQIADKINSSPFVQDQFGVDSFMNTCYGSIGYRFFHFYWKKFNKIELQDYITKNLTQILVSGKIIDINFSISRLLTNDKNLMKIQYICKNISTDIKEEVRSIWLDIARENEQSELTDFLSDERYLLLKLNNIIPNKFVKKAKKI